MKELKKYWFYFLCGIFLLLGAFAYCCGQSRYEVPCRTDLLQLKNLIMLAQVGVVEKTGHNDGPKIKKYLASVGLKEGNPYCAAGQVWCFVTACDSLKLNRKEIPIRKTGLANGIYNDGMKRGKRTAYNPQKYDLIVWKSISGWSGHIEGITKVGKMGWIVCVGFNTGGSNPREGQGVKFTKRNISHPLTRFLRVRGLIGFNAK